MRETAWRHGILFVLHDNYIDHYPDAAGFSYDDTVFDEDGAPVKAWFNFNKGKRAQSYDAQALADFAALGIRTDGAFRLERDGDKALILTPIPDSGPFHAEIDLAAIKGFAAGLLSPALPPASAVVAVEPIEPSPDATPPD